MTRPDDEPSGWQLVGETLRWLFTKPKPEPVAYLRCSCCEEIAPLASIRHITGSRGVRWVHLAPDEVGCLLCGKFSPRVVGDDIDPAAPGTETVDVECRHRFGFLLAWRRCRTVSTVPATAAVIQCTACGNRTPGPSQGEPRD